MSARRLRLLVIVNVYRPDLGGGVLFTDLCEGLAERGIDVTVKCAYSYYPEWKDKTGKNGWTIRSTEENHVIVQRHGIYIPANPNSLFQRLLYEGSFYLSLRRRLPGRNALDAILVICPLVGAVAYATAVRRRTRAPLWLNVQDLSAQAAAAGGIAGGGIVSRMLVRIQDRLFHKADLWSSISEPMVRTLQEIRGTRDQVELIPNWMHESLGVAIRQAREQNELREQSTSSASGPIQLLYSGNIGTKQNLLGVCQFLHGSSLSFVLRIHGEGSSAAELRSWLEKTEDTRFVLEGLTDETELAQNLCATDYYLITERHGVGNAFIPSKIIPCITAGTPVLAVCDSDSPLGTEVLEHGLGPRIDWSRLDELGSILSRGTVAEEQNRAWRMNALTRSAYYSREAGIDRCEALIRQMYNDRLETA